MRRGDQSGEEAFDDEPDEHGAAGDEHRQERTAEKGVARRQRAIRGTAPMSASPMPLRSRLSAARPRCPESRRRRSRSPAELVGSGKPSTRTIAVANETRTTPTTTGNARSIDVSKRPVGWASRSAANGTKASHADDDPDR